MPRPPRHIRPPATSSTRRWGVALIATLFTLLLAVASPAHAGATPSLDLAHTVTNAAAGTPGATGTIVFIRAHNVWIARGNGTGQRAVTRNGTAARPYRSPSEDNRGIIAVAYGAQIIRMTQHGRILSRFDPPPLRNSAGGPMDGAVNDVALSPDGRHVAWSFVRYTCPIATDCMIRYATGVSTAAAYHRIGGNIYYYAPSWIGNTRILTSGGFLSQVMVHDITSPTARHWFDDMDYAGANNTDLSDGEVSPNGRWVAQIRGYGTHRAIAWYSVRGNVLRGPVPPVPTIKCLTGNEPQHASPTWSPDSQALAWAGKEGIWILRSVPDCGARSQARLAFRGASSPDWSPAPLR